MEIYVYFLKFYLIFFFSMQIRKFQSTLKQMILHFKKKSQNTFLSKNI